MTESDSLASRVAHGEPDALDLSHGREASTPFWEARSPVLALRRRTSLEIIEVGFLFAFLLSYIWIVGQTSWADSWPAFALFFAFTLLSHRLHGDAPADLGVRLDNFGQALFEAITVIVPGLVIALAIGLRLGWVERIDPGSVALAFLRGLPWALFQQYGLQCFFARRLRGPLGEGPGHDLACAAIFAALHLPNPFLTVVTFGAAYCFCALFRRCPNLFALAIAHALSSSVLYHSLPSGITCLMRVGPGCLIQLGLL